MRILIEGENLKDYLAKCHEAFRTGLRAVYGARCYGMGYPGYSSLVRDYEQIVRRVFPEGPPDILLALGYDPRNPGKPFPHKGLERIGIPKALSLNDFWSEAGGQLEAYIEILEKNNIDHVLSLFPQPLDMWRDTPLGRRLVYMPPTFDPAIFNDWKMPREYDVGFLAASTAEKSDFYPERYRIHHQILAQKDLRYLWAAHPGWKSHKRPHPLVGVNFSKAINSCRIFLTSGGIYRNPQPKIFEALASKTLLMTDEPAGAERIGLVDGVNYVKITEENLIDRIRYYLAHEEERERIQEAGYQLAMRRHNCYSRALDFYEAMMPRIKPR